MTKDEKEILLATSFGKAPKELQDAANAVAAGIKSIKKLTGNLTDAAASLKTAEDNQGSLQKAYDAVFNRWDPDTNTIIQDQLPPGTKV